MPPSRPAHRASPPGPVAPPPPLTPLRRQVPVRPRSRSEPAPPRPPPPLSPPPGRNCRSIPDAPPLEARPPPRPLPPRARPGRTPGRSRRPLCADTLGRHFRIPSRPSVGAWLISARISSACPPYPSRFCSSCPKNRGRSRKSRAPAPPARPPPSPPPPPGHPGNDPAARRDRLPAAPPDAAPPTPRASAPPPRSAVPPPPPRTPPEAPAPPASVGAQTSASLPVTNKILGRSAEAPLTPGLPLSRLITRFPAQRIAPPFTRITCPVRNAASSLTRKHAIRATSSGSPHRPSGVSRRTRCCQLSGA